MPTEETRPTITGRILFATISRNPIGVIMSEPTMIDGEEQITVKMFGGETRLLRFREAGLGTDEEVENAMSVPLISREVNAAHRTLHQEQLDRTTNQTSVVLAWDNTIRSLEDARRVNLSQFRYLTMSSTGMLRVQENRSEIEINSFNYADRTINVTVNTSLGSQELVQLNIPNNESLRLIENRNHHILLQLAKRIFITNTSTYLLGGTFDRNIYQSIRFYPTSSYDAPPHNLATIYTLPTDPSLWFSDIEGIITIILWRIRTTFGVPTFQTPLISLPNRFYNYYNNLAEHVWYSPYHSAFVTDSSIGSFYYSAADNMWYRKNASIDPSVASESNLVVCNNPFNSLTNSVLEHINSISESTRHGVRDEQLSFTASSSHNITDLEQRITRLESALSEYLLEKEKITEETRKIHI
jgi:hypothetical protein